MMFPLEPTPEEIAARAATLEQTIQRFQSCRPDFIRSHMAGMGIAKHELTATWDQVPEAIRKVLPRKWAGFGLSGGFGAGKTFAIAAGCAKMASKAVAGRMDAMTEAGSVYELREAIDRGSLHIRPWPLWCNFPGEVAARRAQLFMKSQQGEVEDWILALQDPDRLVILDDIGADCATAQDWAAQVLGRVIDERLRQQAPTVWTSNLDAKGLVDRYGARMFSRLHALAPGIELPKMPDLRLRKSS